MPAQEIVCPECPDESGSGTIIGGNAFSIRIGNKILSFENGQLTLADVLNPVNDGTYNQVTIVNGQIIGASDQVPTYTPDTCCPDVPGTNPAGAIPLVQSSDNLLQQAGGAYFVTPIFQDSASVTWSGAGTTNDPFIATASSSGGGGTGTVEPGNCIEVTPTATGVEVGHEDSPVGSSTFMGMTIDQCGHVTATDAGVDSVVEGSHVIAGATVTINDEGRIIAISVGAGSTLTAGSFTTADGFTVSYNSNGVITAVV